MSQTNDTVHVTTPLPVGKEELTPEFLSSALAPHFTGVQVSDVEIVGVVSGTSTKYLARLSYVDGRRPARAPDRVCIKGAFNSDLRRLALGSADRREAEFYGLIAPDVDIPLPQCWYAATNTEQNQGIVVMEDLTLKGVTFGNVLEPWTVDQVADGLELLARLHRKTWNAGGTYPWLTSSNPLREFTDVTFSVEYWERHFASEDAPDLPDRMKDRNTMRAALDALWKVQDAMAESTVCHGDPHLGNGYFDHGGKPILIDWQSAYAGPAIDDASYFIGGALTVEDRRTHERELFDHYIAALAAGDGIVLDAEQAWLDYRLHHLHGFGWALVDPQMQNPGRVAAMAERHTAAIEDHDAVALAVNDPRAQ